MGKNAHTDKHVPRHLGIILDGNRRWAAAEGLPKMQGHERGYENLKTIAEEALEQGVEYLSAYIFSTENWSRTEEEVGYLMKLVVEVFTRDLQSFVDKGIRVVFLGTREGLSKTVLKAVEQTEKRTSGGDRGTLALCFNYGGQLEIVDTAQRIVADGVPADDVTVALIEEYLYQPEVPPVDFMIRTSGEQRLSNFMLWRMAYAELYFVQQHWPAFSVEDLRTAFEEYSRRQRRFGG